ncbi:extracellular solute-binding protein [Nocardiopsis quinghaiensis]|uniref:extracellular solute-binding protein n=1 Tax=Nocardiopsis quinghaiensis TaxID=464995 RepID=UPI00123BCBE0|nr:extracellular solute-binding protein [Nocardiopsis quinghaiensis]
MRPRSKTVGGPAAEEGASGATVLEVLLSDYPFPGFLDPLRARAAEFERRHPGVRVRVRAAGYEELPALAAEEAGRGRRPALVSYYTGASRQALDTVDAGGGPLFVPVERALAGRSHVWGEPVTTGDAVPAARGFFTYGGELAAVPLGLSTMVLYSNMTALSAAGVTRAPRTWREVASACASVGRARTAPFGVSWPNDGKLFQQWLTQRGVALVDRANGREGRAGQALVGTRGLEELVTWWHRLNADGHFLYTGALEDWPGVITAFAEGEVAMRVGSSFEADHVVRAGREAGFEVEVSPLPHRDGTTPVGNWVGGDALWLADGLEERTRDGALALAMYLTRPESVVAWHKASGSSPTTFSALRSLGAEGWFEAHPHHAVVRDQLGACSGTHGAHGPVIPGSHGFQTALMEAMGDVLADGAEPAERFRLAGTEAQRALEEYNATVASPGPRDPRWSLVGT